MTPTPFRTIAAVAAVWSAVAAHAGPTVIVDPNADPLGNPAQYVTIHTPQAYWGPIGNHPLAGGGLVVDTAYLKDGNGQPLHTDATNGAFRFSTDSTWVYKPTVGVTDRETFYNSNYASMDYNGGSRLEGQLSMRFFHHLPVARAVFQLRNPYLPQENGLTETGTFEMQSNLGSDEGTRVRFSSSGDLAFDVQDRWLVTSDGRQPEDGLPIDVHVLHVLYGNGNPRLKPSGADMTVAITGSGNQGVESIFGFEMAPREEIALMFFIALGDPADQGLTLAALGEQIAELKPGDPLLDGLAPEVLASVANFDFGRDVGAGGGGGGTVPEPSSLGMIVLAAASLRRFMARH